MKKTICAMLTALTLACATAKPAVKLSVDEIANQIANKIESKTGKCVGIGYSDFNDAVAAREESLMVARVDYVKRCLGKEEAEIGFATDYPVNTICLDGQTAAAYDPGKITEKEIREAFK